MLTELLAGRRWALTLYAGMSYIHKDRVKGLAEANLSSLSLGNSPSGALNKSVLVQA